MLEFIGDLGGLFDALFIFGSLLAGLYANYLMRLVLVESIVWKIDRTKIDYSKAKPNE